MIYIKTRPRMDQPRCPGVPASFLAVLRSLPRTNRRGKDRIVAPAHDELDDVDPTSDRWARALRASYYSRGAMVR